MKSLARPLPLRPSGYEGQVRGLASRFSGKFQAVLNSIRPKAGFLFGIEINHII